MNSEKAMAIAEGLTCLKFYPTNPRGIAKIATIITDICKTDQQAEWLEEALLRGNEWPGPGSLRDMILEQFPPPGSPYASYPGLGQKPPSMTAEEQAEWDRMCAQIMATIRSRKFNCIPADGVEANLAGGEG